MVPAEHIVFVDPFSSTQFLAENLKAASIKTSVVYTMRPVSGYVKQRPELFDDCFYLDSLDGISALAQELIEAKVTKIYYGSEHSVTIADQLAKQICPQWANDEATSLCRSDKYVMQEALKSAGLPSIKNMKIPRTLTQEDENQLRDWTFPVVVKPINHGGAYGVMVCHTIEQVKEAVSAQPALGQFYDYASDFFVLQEYLSGEEYFIDTFSHQGNHWVSGIQRYQRQLTNGRPISRYAEVIDPLSPIAKTCIDYVLNVLSAVGMREGFAHTEVMLTPDGPRLIEVNPRVSGAHGSSNKLFQYCGFPSQVELLIAACQNKLMPKITSSAGYYGRKVYLQNQREEYQLRSLNVELLQTLPSFAEALMLQSPGAKVTLPTTLMDTIALVSLVNKDQQQLERDYQQVIQWESAEQLF